MTEDRFIELETRLAYHEDAIQSLSDTVAQQQRRLDQLDALCRQLVERLKTATEMVQADTAADEVPPHY
jgi:SlyX protein